MNAIINDLTDEHNAIELMLKILGQVAENFELNKEVPDEHLNGIVDFFTLFADKCHHGKEENLLFPALVDKGLNLSEQPFALILEEHILGKIYIDNMLEAIRAYKKSKINMEYFIENARKYIDLLSKHIEFETNELFKITGTNLSEDEQNVLKQKFDEFEEEVIGEGIHDQLHIVIDELRDYYLK